MAVRLDMLGVPLEEAADGEEIPEAEVIETLYALDGYLLHDGESKLTLVAADYQPALFETLPPTDHDTWQTHRALLAPYEAQRRDPANLRGWLDAFPGPRSEIAGAAAANVRITDGGFRFEMTLEPNAPRRRFRPAGALTETIAAINLAKRAGYTSISSRSWHAPKVM